MNPNLNQGYEAKDATFKPVFIAVIILFAITLLGLVVSKVFYSQIEKSWVKSQESVSSKANDSMQRPALELETLPSKDYKTFKIEQELKLNAYGWVDPSKNKIHIPIDVAIENALKKGFEVRENIKSGSQFDIPLESGGMKKGSE